MCLRARWPSACPPVSGPAVRGSEVLTDRLRLDTNSIVASILLVVSSVLLVVISAAEASVSAITRNRSHAGHNHTNGLNALLENYIRRRQRVLRSLNVAVTL